MSTLLRTCSLLVILAVAIAIPAATAADSTNSTTPYQDGKLAHYSVSGIDYSSPDYESLALWAGKNGTTRIDYVYGADKTSARLKAAGPSADGKGFAMRFANGHLLDVTPQGNTLLVTDRAGRYRKTFNWLYEGPVEGRGTACLPCVDEAGSGAFVRQHFMARP